MLKSPCEERRAEEVWGATAQIGVFGSQSFRRRRAGTDACAHLRKELAAAQRRVEGGDDLLQRVVGVAPGAHEPEDVEHLVGRDAPVAVDVVQREGELQLLVERRLGGERGGVGVQVECARGGGGRGGGAGVEVQAWRWRCWPWRRASRGRG